MARLPSTDPQPASPLPRLLFMSRWLQLPLYLGLIVAQGVYVCFMVELMHLVEAAASSKSALDIILRNATPVGADTLDHRAAETVVMLLVLGLIDVVMISNLLIMVIVGGYETFVSRMDLEAPPGPARMAVARQRQRSQGEARHRDHRHLVDPPAEDVHQRRLADREADADGRRSIHITFLLSAVAIAAVDRIMPQRATAPRNRRWSTSMATIRQQDFIAERRRRAAVHLLLPPGRLHRRRWATPIAPSSRPAAKDAIAQILTNSRMCAEGHRPICQDTGIVVAFVRVGMDVSWEGATMPLAEMVNEGVRRAYIHPDNTLRASILSRPRRHAEEHRRTTRRPSSTSTSSRAATSRSGSRPRAAARRTSRSSRCSIRPTRSSTGCSRPCRRWARAGVRRACSASASAAPPRRRWCWPRKR